MKALRFMSLEMATHQHLICHVIDACQRFVRNVLGHESQTGNFPFYVNLMPFCQNQLMGLMHHLNTQTKVVGETGG